MIVAAIEANEVGREQNRALFPHIPRNPSNTDMYLSR